jgi:predicted N-formylglutamate amidohydrolase
MKMILSCEHATAAVPGPYGDLFAGAPHILETHRGYDIGALEVTKAVEELAEGAFYGGCSRLLIDLNRSLYHPRLFSEFSHGLPEAEKEAIIARWYTPFRDAALQAVKKVLTSRNPLLHLSVHSFTPELDGVMRTNDIGILYDPQRLGEKDLARRLGQAILATDPGLSVRMNTPYHGTSDGHTTALRRHLKDEAYLGIELEINQRLLEDERGRVAVGQLLLLSLQNLGFRM